MLNGAGVFDFSVSAANKTCQGFDPTSHSGLGTQTVLSLALGLSAFFGFCFLRPRWKGLYAARKRQSDDAVSLPEMPDTFFGWMPVLYKVTEEQVLDSAGLDAYVFLTFFKMSLKLFSVMFVLACTILLPINYKYDKYFPGRSNATSQASDFTTYPISPIDMYIWGLDGQVVVEKNKKAHDTTYLWAYLLFTWIFTGLVFYFMRGATLRIIQVRQDYLGSQSTITDRTIKLSGVPKELRSEDKIKEFLEKLEIGKVESVTIVRNWKTLDDLMNERIYTLRKLEEAWTVHLGRRKSKQVEPSPTSDRSHSGNGGETNEDADEDGQLLGQSHITAYEKPRPTTRLWYGFMRLQSRKVDAIDYFEEKLRKTDDKIKEARKSKYKATPVAFVTMDSIPACQMACQALLDPSPGKLLAKQAPAPSDVVWENTYVPRSRRMVRSWIITIFIFLLTLFWLVPVIALAGLLNTCTIRQVFPQLADVLDNHEILKSLVQTGLPTLVFSLLNVAVPFLYDYLANLQGMISQGDVELSVISKNYFFTFVNLFLVFTVSGTASNFLPTLQGSLKDTTLLAYNLATSVKALADFYINFLLLQSVGLLPFRLLEFGSVSLYPIMLLGSKTPRDYAELVQPPIFKYGFYLPSAILVFILCMVYSILPQGYFVMIFGLIYFVFGYYTYKYQLLYAMDHPQHATGGAWPMICYRVMVGQGVFHLLMAGIIASQKQFTAAALVVPLIPLTIWYSYHFRRTYEPLTKFIALRSIRRENSSDVNLAGEDVGSERPPGFSRRRSMTIDEAREEGLKFVNPNLVKPLEKLWIDKSAETATNGDTAIPLQHEESAASSMSLGDTHVWRDNGDSNV